MSVVILNSFQIPFPGTFPRRFAVHPATSIIALPAEMCTFHPILSISAREFPILLSIERFRQLSCRTKKSRQSVLIFNLTLSALLIFCIYFFHLTLCLCPLSH